MANYRKSFNFRNGVQVDEDNFIVQSTGLVGIGTSQPSEILDVVGNVKISGFTTTRSILSRDGIIGVLTATTVSVTNQSISGNLSAGNLSVSGIATVSGNINLGNDVNTDVLTLGAKVSGSIIPTSNGSCLLYTSDAADD